MALQAASIHAQRMRITRLDSDGTEAAGATASYVTSDLIQVAINPEVTEGEEREVISGGDAVCVSYKGATKLKRFSLELQGCKIDPYLFELLLGAPFVLESTNKIGISFPDQNSTSFSPQQVMVEFWSDAWNGDAPDTANGGPYWHWVFRSSSWQLSDNTMQNDFLLPTLRGTTRSNPGMTAALYTVSPVLASTALGPLGGVYRDDEMPDATPAGTVAVA